MHKESVLPRDKEVGCYCGGVINWRTALVHYAAKIAGLRIKVEGMPLGTGRNIERAALETGGKARAGLEQASQIR